MTEQTKARKVARPTDDALHAMYWALRKDGHGIIGAQQVLVDAFEDVRFGATLDQITHGAR